MEGAGESPCVVPAVRSLDAQAIREIAIGSTLLGAGGGGETYLAELRLQQALKCGSTVEIVGLSDVPDDALVAACGWMGAPTVQKEKYPNGSEAELGLEKLEQILGRPLFAVFPIEIGGQNALTPMLLAARRGIPVVDCDGMGRAFPEAQMVTFNVSGCSAFPAVFTDEKGSCLVMELPDNRQEETLGRQIAVAMGGQCHVIDYPMLGRQLKQFAVRDTISIARGIGRASREAARNRENPFTAILSYLGTTEHYRHARILFDGMIVDLDRSVRDGFDKGHTTLEGVEDCSGEVMRIEFQNENLIACRNGAVVATVPDIVALVDRESAAAINTEELRYGLRVKVLGISVPPVLRTPEALNVLGPRCFGLDVDYVPMQALDGNADRA